MNRNHLALFHAVASAGSITGGAAAARISQPAVSKQVGELESALGVRLFERLPRGCALTQAGRTLFDYAGRWMALESEAGRAMQELRGLRRGRLTIGASLTVGGYLLTPVLAAFHRRHPGVELHLEVANTEVIERKVLELGVEAGLTEGRAEAQELSSEVFFEDEIVAVAPAGHPLLRASRVTARDVCAEPIILRERGSGTRAVVERALHRRGLAPKPVLTLASAEAIKGAVAAGLGLAFMSRLVVAAEVRSGALGVVRMADLGIRRPLHLQRVRGRADSPALAGFLGILRDMLRPGAAAPGSTPAGTGPRGSRRGRAGRAA